jgi:hypothetical protein
VWLKSKNPLSEAVRRESEEEWTEEEFPALDVDCRTDSNWVDPVMTVQDEKDGATMNDLVDRILHTYQLMRKIDKSAGQFDAQQLAMYGLAYLKELHEGSDPRFTGC